MSRSSLAWALRPKLSQRADDFDVYDYGEDKEDWTEDDGYAYFGTTVSLSSITENTINLWYTGTFRVRYCGKTQWHSTICFVPIIIHTTH